MTRADCIRALMAEYRQQRLNNEQEQERRIAEIMLINPEIAKLRDENRELAFSTLKKVMALTDDKARVSAAHAMKERGLKNNQTIRTLLSAAGYAPDYLDIHYRCDKCKDTGMLGDAPSRFCDCFETSLRRKLFEDSGMAEMERQNFSTFDLSRFPEENGQRTQMASVRRACETYANNFPNGTRTTNLLLMGSGGLGKSFLLNCIYERVLSNGLSAVRMTAFRMFEAMRRQHFANSNDEMDFDRLIEAPMLLIDDLGTEPMMRNITIEYLFTLLNERLAARLHTVIATNLSPTQIRETYGERVSSRLLDRENCATILLKGKDLRLL